MYVNGITQSSVNEVTSTSLLINGVTKIVDPTSNSQPKNFSCGENSQLSSSSIGTNKVTLSSTNKVTPSISLVNEITSTSQINEITRSSLPINETTSSSDNKITSSLFNVVTTIVNPTSTSQPNDCNCQENLQMSSSWPIIGVGVLLFTNIITVFMFITSCLCLLRLNRKHEEM